MRYVLKSWPACSPSSKEMNFILLFTLKKLAKTIRIWKERYDRVIKYLEGVAAGTRTPSLPLLTDEKGEVRIKMRCGSNPKFRHSF